MSAKPVCGWQPKRSLGSYGSQGESRVRDSVRWWCETRDKMSSTGKERWKVRKERVSKVGVKRSGCWWGKSHKHVLCIGKVSQWKVDGRERLKSYTNLTAEEAKYCHNVISRCQQETTQLQYEPVWPLLTLLRNPLRTLAALTDNERGILICFSNMTVGKGENEVDHHKLKWN